MRARTNHISRTILGATVLAVAACADSATAPDWPSTTTRDPAQAQIVTADIKRYWEAVDAGGGATDFETRYLQRGSAGLRDFTQRRQLSGAAMRAAFVAAPQYLASIRPTSLSLATDTAVRNRIRRNFAVMQQRYPDAIFPPVTFLIGRFSTGGTVGASGILIGAEFYTKTATSPLHELNPFVRNNARPIDSIAIIVAHEHVHVLQLASGGLYARGTLTLLEQALLEGSADFLGELVSGSQINAGLHVWALPREDSLWTAFRAAMHGTSISQWLYNQSTATAERPGDLGYFIGYRIAQAYYDAATDKTAAIRDIIRVRDADAFLAASGYDPSGAALSSPVSARRSSSGGPPSP